MTPKQSSYDVVIVGGGHNGLVAAAYLARAGLSTLVLERQPVVGGAVVSLPVFAGIDARLSRYSYLLSMFPEKIRADLGLRFATRHRTIASYTPTVRDGQHTALLIGNGEAGAHVTAESFRRLTGSDAEYHAYVRYYDLIERFAQNVFPSMLQPLVTRAAMKSWFQDADGQAAWEMLVEQPLGQTIERMFQDDSVRGAVFTDAKIATLTHPHDETLQQNRTYLYHVIGQGTGEWNVVVGGMGRITSELAEVARAAGAEIITSASVQQVRPGQRAEVEFTQGEVVQHVGARYILANVAPAVLNKMMPGGLPDTEAVEGSAFKVNMLLKRLPRLRATDYTSEQAFTGTFHLDEGYAAMQQSYHSAARGELPDKIPGETYCHTLTDPSILPPELRQAGYQTVTLFGLDMPARLFRANNEATRAEATRRYLQAINQYLGEPIEDCLAQDRDGKPCIEAHSPLDLEAELGMPAGHIFHRDLTWPFVEDAALAGTWGVETAYPNLIICGSGALRGGCVSGIPGHNAAMKVLEIERRM